MRLARTSKARVLPVRGGAVGSLMRSFDWSETDIGPPESWPLSLCRYVDMILEMPTPVIIFWGPQQTQLYNDGYAVIMGPRHPRFFADSYKACWPETYPLVYPWIQRVLKQGEFIGVKNELVTLTRHGFVEEAYFTFTLSPLRSDEGAIEGVLQPVLEVTDTVLAERRSETLRKLGALVDSPALAARGTVAPLSENPKDIPLSLVYFWDDQLQKLVLAVHSGCDQLKLDDGEMATTMLRIAHQTFETGTAGEVEELSAALGQQHVGHWPEPTRRAYAVPLRRSASDAPRGAAIFGISPRLAFDERYREFLGRVARELAANRAAEQAKALEQELLKREQAARRQVERQKENLSALLMQAPMPITVLRGPEFVIELANPSVCEVWMRREAELIDKPLFDALPELRTQVFLQPLERVYRSGKSFKSTEVLTQFVSPSGTETDAYFNFLYAPLRSVEGNVDGILVVAVDVTEQVRAREQVERLKTAAEAASRAKDEFLAVLGHELRNPLAPILTALQLMRLRGVTGVEREREVIERQANHLVRLVDDLLDISRIISGKAALHRRRVSLAEVISRAVEMARPVLEQRRHELIVDIGPEQAPVDVDAGRLAQAVANLLTNAAKYTEPAGCISVFAGWRDDSPIVSVRDSGTGIEPHMLPRIFDAFVQEQQALDRSQGGLGLGLAIVRGIAELHGGSVEARSGGRGKGSEFIIHLPPNLAAGSELSPESHSRSSIQFASEEQRQSILVVDDSRDSADTLAASLELLGHEVVVAYDGPSALALARKHPPSIALLDIGLPVMDGYELARGLHALPGLESLPLLAITGYGQETDKIRSRAAGFSAHLVKPISLEQVQDLVISMGGRSS